MECQDIETFLIFERSLSVLLEEVPSLESSPNGIHSKSNGAAMFAKFGRRVDCCCKHSHSPLTFYKDLTGKHYTCSL